MQHPDPIPVSTTNYLRRQADKEDAIDEAYDSLALEMMSALQRDPEELVHLSFPDTAAAILIDGIHHAQHGDAFKRVFAELVMDAYRAGDPRALWAVDTIVHEHADFHASDVAAESLE